MKTFVIFLFLIYSNFLFGEDLEARKPNNKLNPFTTDGCSVVPDLGLTECCVIHDIAYWKGGTKKQRELADLELGLCIEKKSNKFLASLFYWGVRIGGRPQLLTSFRWGYGWQLQRGYRPLSVEEKKAISKLEPKNPLETPITDPSNNLIKHPVVHGNYCMDQVFDYIGAAYAFSPNQSVTNVYKTEDQFQTILRVKMSNNDAFLFKFWYRKWQECQRPQYAETLPLFYHDVFEY